MKKIINFIVIGVLVVFLTGCNENVQDKLYDNYSNKIEDATSSIIVPVAKEDILENTLITVDMIEFKEFNENQLNQDDITNVNMILGKVTTTEILKGSTFISSYFSE